jgi:hypothetical protein
MPIDLIREKLPDRDQKKTGFRLQFQCGFSHPRPTSSTFTRRVEGRGFLMRQHENRQKETTQTFLPTSSNTSRVLSPLSRIARSHYLKMTTWKKEENDCPFFFSK